MEPDLFRPPLHALSWVLPQSPESVVMHCVMTSIGRVHLQNSNSIYRVLQHNVYNFYEVVVYTTETNFYTGNQGRNLFIQEKLQNYTELT